jgi:hypothetical protein
MATEHSKPARVVAELGRPETPQETADRKAAAAQKRRSQQTATNLVLALAACLAVVLILVLIVVRPSSSDFPTVDYRHVAEAAQPGIDQTLAAPELPDGWSANAARLSTGSSDGVDSWYIGFLTPDHQFIALRQAMDGNDTWIAAQVEGAHATGSIGIAGIGWKVYDQRAQRDAGNLAYALSATRESSSYVLYGTAKTSEFEVLAKALAQQLDETRTN